MRRIRQTVIIAIFSSLLSILLLVSSSPLPAEPLDPPCFFNALCTCSKVSVATLSLSVSV